MEFKYEYTRLLVADFKACFLFYRDVMGFQATYGSENDVYADFNTGTTTLALFDQGNMSKAIGTTQLPVQTIAQDKVCFIYKVEDVDAMSQRLNDMGVQMVTQPTDHADWGIRAAHFRDPEGNLIEIYQPLQRE